MSNLAQFDGKVRIFETFRQIVVCCTRFCTKFQIQAIKWCVAHDFEQKHHIQVQSRVMHTVLVKTSNLRHKVSSKTQSDVLCTVLSRSLYHGPPNFTNFITTLSPSSTNTSNQSLIPYKDTQNSNKSTNISKKYLMDMRNSTKRLHISPFFAPLAFLISYFFFFFIFFN